MKKSNFLVMLFCLISIILLASTTAFATANDYDFGEKSYAYMKDFVSANPYRMSVDDDVTPASANYIKNFATNYSSNVVIDEYQHPENSDKTTLAKGYNVYVQLGDVSQKIVLILSHYDNYYTTENTKNEGVYNATSVGLSMSILEYLSTAPTSYGVIVAFLDAEEIGLYGSKRLYEYLDTQQYLDRVKLCIDFEYVGGGDNLYLYADELPRQHSEYFEKFANISSLKPIPNNKNIVYTDSGVGLKYTHPGLNTSIAPFYKNNIPCLNFLGGYWPNNGMYYMESATKQSIMFTSKDNLEDFDRMYGETCVVRLRQLGESLTSMMLDGDFVSTMVSSRDNINILLMLQKTDFDYLICIPVILIFAIVVLIKYLKINKNQKKSGHTSSNQSKNQEIKQKVFQEFDL